MPPSHRPVADRIWKYVHKTETCWLWTGHLNNNGYGKIGDEGRRSVYAHRAMYELLIAPIPPGLTIDHLCRTPACVNPAHLEPVTHAENLRRGRHAQSEKTHCPQGHPYEGRNVLVSHRGNGNPFRLCRTCLYERGKLAKRKMRAERRALGISEPSHHGRTP